jgi:hypothetical protein
MTKHGDLPLNGIPGRILMQNGPDYNGAEKGALSLAPGLRPHLVKRDTQFLGAAYDVILARKNPFHDARRGIHDEQVLPDAIDLVAADLGRVRYGAHRQKEQNRDRQTEQKRFFIHNSSFK